MRQKYFGKYCSLRVQCSMFDKLRVRYIIYKSFDLKFKIILVLLCLNKCHTVNLPPLHGPMAEFIQSTEDGDVKQNFPVM